MTTKVRKNSPLLRVSCFHLEQARIATLTDLARYREQNERPFAAGRYADLIRQVEQRVALLDAVIARRADEHLAYLAGCLNRAEQKAIALEQAGHSGAVSARQVAESFRTRIEEVRR